MPRVASKATQTQPNAQQAHEAIRYGTWPPFFSSITLLIYGRVGAAIDCWLHAHACAQRAVYTSSCHERARHPTPHHKHHTTLLLHRPVNVLIHPDTLSEALPARQRRLYRLIWLQAVTSLMKAAIDQHVTVTIGPADASLQLTARGQWNTVAGYLTAYAQVNGAEAGLDNNEDGDQVDKAEVESPGSRAAVLAKRLAGLHVGEPLTVVDVQIKRVDPAPPPRYTEAALVAALTKLGIGRPSTYASVLAGLQVCLGERAPC